MEDLPEKKGITHEEYGRFIVKLREIAYNTQPFLVRDTLREFVAKLEKHYETL